MGENDCPTLVNTLDILNAIFSETKRKGKLSLSCHGKARLCHLQLPFDNLYEVISFLWNNICNSFFPLILARKKNKTTIKPKYFCLFLFQTHTYTESQLKIHFL